MRFIDELGEEFARVQEQAGRRSLRAAPPARAWIVLAASVLVVVAVAAAVLSSGRRPAARSAGRGEVDIAFVAPGHGAGDPLLARAGEILAARLKAAFPQVQVVQSGRAIDVSLPGAPSGARARILTLAAPGYLAFYDWEADALMPSGATVASALRRQDPTAIQISQGQNDGPGATGGLPLFEAVSLAARQRAGRPFLTQYYLFGRPGSAACRAAAREFGVAVSPGAQCLLAGPADSRATLAAELPAGVHLSDGEELAVSDGMALEEALANGAPLGANLADPSARFFVLRRAPFVRAPAILRPRVGRDASGAPDVQFALTHSGAARFQSATRAIARRGQLLSRPGQTLEQHFAVALDGELISVPSIDFKVYPDGVPGGFGVDVSNGFTAQTAHDLAILLRFGVIPLQLQAR